MDFNIPVNSTAELHIPTNAIEKIMEGTSPLAKSKDIKIIATTATEIIVALGSGKYHFTIKN